MFIVSRVVVFITILPMTSSTSDVVTMDGDVMIGGLFTIQSGDDCSRIHPVSVQTHQAVKWTLDQLKQQNFTPYLTVGLKAFKTCGQSSQAVRHTTEMLGVSTNRSKVEDIYGVIGPESSSETEEVSRFLSSLPVSDRLLQLVYSSTSASLGDQSRYSNLYRVIETDNVQVEVMVQLLLNLQWNYVAIGYQAGVYGTNGAHALREAAEANGICIPIFQEIGTIGSIIKLRERLDIQSSPVSGMVFIGGGSTVTSIVEYFDQHLKLDKFQLIASEALALEPNFLKDGTNAIYDRAKGILVPSPVYAPISGFSTYWNMLFENETMFREEVTVNPWIELYFEFMTGCALASNTDIRSCWSNSLHKYTMVQQPMYISYAVLATSILVHVLKNVHADLCPNMYGPCDAMRRLGKESLLKKVETLGIEPRDYINGLFPMMTNASFKNGLIDWSVKERYEIYNYQAVSENAFSFVKVGSFNGSLSISNNNVYAYDRSGKQQGPADGKCKIGFLCSECLSDPAKKIVFIPGDFYVVGLVPIHNRHATSNSWDSYFQYGPLRESISVEIADAMIHAVITINKKSGQFSNLLGEKKIGLILLDTSNNPLIVKDKVVSLHKGELALSTKVKSSTILDKIIGYAGPVASSISIPLSPTMQQLNQLFIAYGSTSSKLSDRKEFPTFMRTSAPLDKQVIPMLKVAKEIGADYIQVLYTDESYGESGKDAVLQGAKTSDVCVAQTVAVKEGVSPEDYIGVVNELRRFRHARLVVVFARSHTAPALLKAVNKELKELGEFIFFGSGEGWAKRMKIISGNTKLQGSFTMAQDLPIDPEFADYFQNESLRSGTNPWLREYLELKGNCYFPESFQKKSTDPKYPKTPCTNQVLSGLYGIDTWVPFAANAVFALALGFNKTLTEVCRKTNTKCDRYTTAELIRWTTEVKLDIYKDKTRRRVFDEDGNGASGFKISQIVYSKLGDLVYKDIGIVTTDQFVFDKSRLDKDLSYTSSCPEYECTTCKTSQRQESSSSSSYIAAVAVESVVIVILIVVIVVLCVKFRSKRDAEKNLTPTYSSCGQCTNAYSKGCMNADYLTAVYHECDSNDANADTSKESSHPEVCSANAPIQFSN